MKSTILGYLFFFSYLVCYSQNGQIEGEIISTDLDALKYLNIVLVQNKKAIRNTMVDKDGHFFFNNLPKEKYSIRVQELGGRDFVVDNVEIGANLKIEYPFPCKYNLMDKPKCPNGHTNHIINIAYGLPGEKLRRKAKKGKVHLGGCIITDCDPHYYCKMHKVEF